MWRLWVEIGLRVMGLTALSAVIALGAGTTRRGGMLAYVELYGESTQARMIDVDWGLDRLIRVDTACQIAWSPGGEVLVTTTPPGAPHQVALIDPFARETRILTGGGMHNEAPALSPDGLRIVYAANQSYTNTLYAMSLHGRELERVGDVPLWVNRTEWTADGERVIVTGAGVNRRTEVYSLHLASGRAEPVTHAAEVNLSPDGRWIAEIVQERRGYSLRVKPAGGGEGVMLAAGFQAIDEVVWSADGRRIAFSAQRRVVGRRYDRLTPFDLYVVGCEGGAVARVRRGAGAYINNYSRFCAVAWRG